MEKIVYKCNCIHCNNESLTGENNLVPGKVPGYDCDEFIRFYIKCPICHHLNVISMQQIPNEIKIKVMKKYAGITGLTHSLIELKAEVKEKMKKIEEITSKIENIKNDPNRNDMILFPEELPNPRRIDTIIRYDYVNEDPKQFIKIKKR